jgi:hypothetical protein
MWGEMSEQRWVPVEDRLPAIDPLGVTATVIVAHAEYSAHREPTGNVAVSPASYLGSDQQGPFFKSMINGRRLDSRAWMPLPEPPAEVRY